MKNIRQILVLFCLLILLTSTTCEQEPNYYSKSIKVTNLIHIEKKVNYDVNDVLFINALFSRFLPEDAFGNLLDIYRTTLSDRYIISYYLSKKNADNTMTNALIYSNLIIDKGEIIDQNSEKHSLCILDKNTNKYEFRIGIPLLESGEYVLKIEPILNPYQINNKINLVIKTTVNDIEINKDSIPSYNFTVN